ncbi:MAG: HD domain-containing protein [Candidatus Peregrinibacteria bacterium]|nr:HD domain-containing protein [Candidatus Peregrinibacteria bacterium]
MNFGEQLKKIRLISEKMMSCSAHDCAHVDRVYNLCLTLAKGQKVDLQVLEMAALIHDVGREAEHNDKTGKTDHAKIGADVAENVLRDLGFDESKILHVKECILSHRFRGKIIPKSLEAKILFDADKLDTLGAIGIARSYVWVGKNNAKIYTDVDLNSYVDENIEGGVFGRIKDKTKHSPQIEFDLKFGNIKEKLFTKEAKKIATERTKFYSDFLKRLEKEIEGKL